MPGIHAPLERSMGVRDVFAVAAGAMISSGLFVLPGLAFDRTGASMILAYAAAGVLIAPTMLAQVELSTAMPRSASSYFVVERSLGAYMGTVAGLINWFAISLKATFALVGLGTMALYLSPGGGTWLVKLVAVSAAAAFTLLNLVSARHAGRLQGVLVTGLVVVLGLYIAFGVKDLEAARFGPFFGGGFKDFMAVTGMVFISFGGLNKAVDIAEEVDRPGRNLPLGMFLAFGVVMLLYLGVTFVTVGIMDGEVLRRSLRPVTQGAEMAMGVWGLVVMGAAALMAYASTGNAGILAASRSPMAMSRDGLLPAVFSRTNRRFGTPHVAVLITGGAMILMMALLSLENLVKTASTMLLISLGLINLSVIVMRHSGIESYRPTFRMPLCPWLPLACVVAYAFLIAEMGMIPLLSTAGFLAAASIWYVAYVQRKIDRVAAVAYLVKSILSQHIRRTGLEDELVHISMERDEVEMDRFDKLVRDAPILDIKEKVSAEDLFQAVGEVLNERLKLPAERIRQLLLAREGEFSTVIQPGLAIPHVVVDGKSVFELVLVRCREGAVFSELHPPVTTAFVLLGSADERTYHLRALVAIAHVVQEPEFRQRWREAANAEQLRDIVLLSSRERNN